MWIGNGFIISSSEWNGILEIGKDKQMEKKHKAVEEITLKHRFKYIDDKNKENLTNILITVETCRKGDNKSCIQMYTMFLIVTANWVNRF